MTSLADPATRRRRPPPTAWVIGVDTHTDTHAATLIDEVGTVVAQIQHPATPAGYTRLQTWAEALIPTGQRMFWAIEGTRSHGHGLTRHLRTAGQRVVEAPKPEARRRRQGKSDPLDATHAAQAALATDGIPPHGTPSPAPTAHAKPYACCWSPAGTTPTSAPPPSTCSNPCC